MKKETITEIEKRLPPDGLSGYIFHLLADNEFVNLCDVVSLPEGGVGMALKGSAPVTERREMFLKIYSGCKRIANEIKKDTGWAKEEAAETNK